VTCGGSECQQAEYQANATRTKRKPRQQTICTCGHTLAQHVNGRPIEGCLAGMTNLMRRNGLCSCERFTAKETP
jgi:hypothetical protein